MTIKRRRNDSTFESLDEKDHAYDKPRLKYGGFLESSTVMVGTKMEKVINHTCTCSMSEEENVERKRPSKKKKRFKKLLFLILFCLIVFFFVPAPGYLTRNC